VGIQYRVARICSFRAGARLFVFASRCCLRMRHRGSIFGIPLCHCRIASRMRLPLPLFRSLRFGCIWIRHPVSAPAAGGGVTQQHVHLHLLLAAEAAGMACARGSMAAAWHGVFGGVPWRACGAGKFMARHLRHG